MRQFVAAFADATHFRTCHANALRQGLLTEGSDSVGMYRNQMRLAAQFPAAHVSIPDI